ncbi:hypothetical protein BDZ45DRAFT_730683 [Acephala macrosclerotiorum]|nr:hypothetical protein BDZ45DRAFT_730683 [Acephala macrosclerotiorum]
MSSQSEDNMRLALFTDELPDASEELFLQHHFDLTAFTYFAKLPSELRVKIWHATFPKGRLVKLNPPRNSTSGATLWPSERPLEPPVALSINSESRREVQKHYIVLSHHEYFASHHGFPLFFNPSRDEGYITRFALIQSPDSKLWFGALQDRFPEHFAKIRTLRISDWYWDKDMKRRTEHVLQWGCRIGKWGAFFHMEPLLRFPNLSHIKFITLKYPQYQRLNNDTFAKQEEMRLLLGRYLEFHKDVWNGVVPTFELERWAPTET